MTKNATSWKITYGKLYSMKYWMYRKNITSYECRYIKVAQRCTFNNDKNVPFTICYLYKTLKVSYVHSVSIDTFRNCVMFFSTLLNIYQIYQIYEVWNYFFKLCEYIAVTLFYLWDMTQWQITLLHPFSPL